MAIDTAAKRRSAGSAGFTPWVPGVTPNASKPVAWRQQSGWGYSGIPTAALSIATGVATVTVLYRKPAITVTYRRPRITVTSRN